MKRNADENLLEIKSLNKQCSQYEEQIGKLKKDVRKVPSQLSCRFKVFNFRLDCISHFLTFRSKKVCETVIKYIS